MRRKESETLACRYCSAEQRKNTTEKKEKKKKRNEDVC
jgi:hypothetical protein